jgi:hypothetical protein
MIFLFTGCSPAGLSIPSNRVLAKEMHLRETATPPVTSKGTPTSVNTDGVKRVQNVLEALQRFDRTGRNRDLQQVYFEMPESDINQYLAYSLHAVPRPGIAAVTVKIKAGNRISATTTLDFDRIGEWVPLLPALLQMTGNRAITADVVFAVQNGGITFQFPGSDGSPMARRALQTLLHILAMHQPEQYDTSEPVPLPYGLQQLWTTEGVLVGET